MESKARKSRKWVPLLCNILGSLILTGVILVCLPLSLPRMLGYEMYHVITGSMEPELPVGSLIYVEIVSPEEIEAEDIIAFRSEGTVITHRVLRNRLVEGEFVTKGDANAQADMNTVLYEELIGRVVYHIPVLGGLMALWTSTIGKLYMLCLAACGVMFHMLASRLRERARENVSK